MAITKVDDRGLNTPVDLLDNEKIRFGTGNDLEIFHDGSNSYIKEAGTGQLMVQADNLILENAAGANYLVGISGGEVILYHNDQQKFETLSDGVKINGVLHWDSGNSGRAIELLDNQKIFLGTGTDLQIYHDGSHSYIKDAGTGNLKVQSDSSIVTASTKVQFESAAEDEVLAVFYENDRCELYHNGTKKLETVTDGTRMHGNAYLVASESGDANFYLYADDGDDNADKWLIQAESDGFWALKNYTSGAWETNIKTTGNGSVELYYDNVRKLYTTGDGVQLNDDIKLLIGSAAGGDLQIFHSGSWNYIQNHNSKNLAIQVGASGDENAIIAVPDGSVQLYYDTAKKLETTSTGVKITGTRTDIDTGGTEDCFRIGNTAGCDTAIRLGSIGTDPDTHAVIKYDKDENWLSLLVSGEAHGAGGLLIENGGDVRADDLIPHSDNSRDLGSSSIRWRDIYVSNNISVENSGKLLVGTDNDLQIYHDDTNNLIVGTTGDLYQKSADDMFFRVHGDESAISIVGDAGVELFYDSVKKFETRSGGIGVFGHIEAGDDQQLMLGDSNDLKIYHNGSNNYITTTLAGAGLIIRHNYASGNLIDSLDINDQGRMYNNCNDGSHSNLTLRKTDNADSIDYFQCRSGNNTLKMRVEGDGDVANANNSYGSTSDVKLKENIVDANSQWNDIKAVKVRNFNFKTDPDKKLLGVVAQEVETVSAGLVSETIDRNPDTGEDLGTKTKSVKYSILYMKAIKALQEAMARIETLETEVAALKG